MNMIDYPTLHLDTNYSTETAYSKKDMDVNEHERLSNITQNQVKEQKHIFI